MITEDVYSRNMVQHQKRSAVLVFAGKSFENGECFVNGFLNEEILMVLNHYLHDVVTMLLQLILLSCIGGKFFFKDAVVQKSSVECSATEQLYIVIFFLRIALALFVVTVVIVSCIS